MQHNVAVFKNYNAIERKFHVEIDFIEIERHPIIGANTTVLPNITFHEGAAVGLQSLVNLSLDA